MAPNAALTAKSQEAVFLGVPPSVVGAGDRVLMVGATILEAMDVVNHVREPPVSDATGSKPVAVGRGAKGPGPVSLTVIPLVAPLPLTHPPAAS